MSKTRKYRKKRSEGTEEDLQALASTQSTVTSNLKESQASKEKLNRLKMLSFTEEDGENNFVSTQIKAKNQVKIVQKRESMRNLKSQPQNDKEQPLSTQMSAAGSYTPEMMKELKKNAVQLEGANKSKDKTASSSASQALITFKGSFKPVDPAKDDRFEISATALTKDKSPRNTKPAFVSIDNGIDQNNGNTDMQIDEVMDMVDYSKVGLEEILAGDEADALDEEYPDNEVVEKAKQYRASRRLAYLPADYVAPNWEELKNRGVVKTLPTEGGNDGDEDEDEEHDHLRMAFMGTSSKKQQQRMRQEEINAGLAQVENDDLGKQWEQAQSKRAIFASGPQPALQAVSHNNYQNGDAEYMQPLTDATGLQNAEQIVNQLKRSIEKQCQQQQEEQGRITRIRASVLDAKQQIEKDEVSLKQAEKKYSYVQLLRDYIFDLCECLDAKSSLVEELEEQMTKLRQDRSSVFQNEIALHDEEWETIAKAVAEAVMKSIRSGNLNQAGECAEKALKEIEQQIVNKDFPQMLDEFGRDLNLGQRKKCEHRKAHRQHVTMMAKEYIKQEEDMPQDLLQIKEDQKEINHYNQRKQELLQASKQVFEDAAESYGTIGGVASKLEVWRTSYPNTFQQAYASTSSLALYAPFIRLELLSWDPMYPTPGQLTPTLIEQSWIIKLLPVSNETEIVPKLIDKLAVPIAMHYVQDVWDPLVEDQCNCIFNILKDFMVFQQKDEVGQEFLKLLGLVEDKLRKAIQKLDFPLWPVVVEEAHVVLKIYIENQIHRAIQLLKGINRFQQILSESLLKDLVVGELLKDKICPYLLTISSNADIFSQRAQLILDNFPRNWKWLELRHSMQPFVDVLIGSARQLQAQPGRWKKEIAANSDTPQKIATLLIQFGEVERATKLTESFRSLY